MDEKELSKDELFQAYKNQHVAEARFRNLKTDLVVRPIYLRVGRKNQSLNLCGSFSFDGLLLVGDPLEKERE